MHKCIKGIKNGNQPIFGENLLVFALPACVWLLGFLSELCMMSSGWDVEVGFFSSTLCSACARLSRSSVKTKKSKIEKIQKVSKSECLTEGYQLTLERS